VTIYIKIVLLCGSSKGDLKIRGNIPYLKRKKLGVAYFIEREVVLSPLINCSSNDLLIAEIRGRTF